MEDYDKEYEQQKAAVERMVNESPVVSTCKQDDCTEPIREGEISLGTASMDSCWRCTLAYVAEMIG
jgi:hypothetical protein